MQGERVPDARRTDAVLLLVALVWGSSYLSAQTATAVLPVLVVLFARYALSALACLGLVAADRKSRGWTRDELRIGVPLGITQAAVLVVETYGVAHTSAANAGLIISLTIVITPLLDRSGHRGGLRSPSTQPLVCACWPSACSCRATVSTRPASATC